ncbi:hypothetical protein Fcan01_24508 [Folsomia candida]|uniref:Uncharacterized protein n=1 Tax=Folsomia candida TaxID=158441 RepID=A0A226D4Z9_FOLCA|nr:hypothetical protein Fcan01_24508 [Folsomia candida]
MKLILLILVMTVVSIMGQKDKIDHRVASLEQGGPLNVPSSQGSGHRDNHSGSDYDPNFYYCQTNTNLLLPTTILSRSKFPGLNIYKAHVAVCKISLVFSLPYYIGRKGYKQEGKFVTLDKTVYFSEYYFESTTSRAKQWTRLESVFIVFVSNKVKQNTGPDLFNPKAFLPSAERNSVANSKTLEKANYIAIAYFEDSNLLKFCCYPYGSSTPKTLVSRTFRNDNDVSSKIHLQKRFLLTNDWRRYITIQVSTLTKTSQ